VRLLATVAHANMLRRAGQPDISSFDPYSNVLHRNLGFSTTSMKGAGTSLCSRWRVRWLST